MARTVLVVALVFCVAAHAQEAVPAAEAPPARVKRIYVAPFSGETSDAATLDLVEDRVLVAARAVAERSAHAEESGDVELIGARDVQGILDVEAAKAAVGCDSTSCANEIADALNADEIVFGQLGRIGDTWQLTLTRTHRATLRVLGRSVKEARGETPEGLLDDIDDQVGEVFGVVVEGPRVLFIGGLVGASVGVAAVAVGGIAYAISWGEYDAAVRDLTPQPPAPTADEVKSAQEHRAAGEGALTFAYVVGGIGIVVAAASGVALAFDAMAGE